MKIKSILLSSLLALGCTAASAQEEAKTVNVFGADKSIDLFKDKTFC